MNRSRRPLLCSLVASVVAVCLLALGGPRLAAAPEAPAVGGVFTVNSNADSNASDNVLTFREALLLARGGTGGAAGLARALSAPEQAQLSGCTLSGGLITGGCGAGFTNTIGFALVASTISLGSPLPHVDNTQPTIVDGTGFLRPIVDAGALAAGQNGLSVVSNNNVLKVLSFANSPHHNLVITGSNTLVENVWALNAALDGIYVAGDNNTLDNVSLGISASTGGCFANAGFGARFAAGTVGNAIKNSNVACNGFGGIAVAFTNGPGNHQIGPNNRIGISPSGAARPNGSDGILVSSNNNAVFSNTVAYNAFNGIDVYGNFNSVYNNTVLTNTRSGVRLFGPASNNFVGCNFLCGTAGGNSVKGNLASGIELTGTLVAFNIVVSNTVSGPGEFGVLLDGAHNNYVGDAGFGNALAGVTAPVGLDHGAYGNQVAGNVIGSAGAYSSDGVAILHDAHDNVIGGATAAKGNRITHNAIVGIYVSGSGSAGNTAGNLIANNLIDQNGFNGIHIAYGAHDTIVGGSGLTNTITRNGSDGILIDTGAYSNAVPLNYIGFEPGVGNRANLRHGIAIVGSFNNTIGATAMGNTVAWNQGDGIVVTGTGSYGNLLIGNSVLSNAGSGVSLDGNAHGNSIGMASKGNTVEFNQGDGVLLLNSHDNALRSNSIAYNQRNGVALDGNSTYDNRIELGSIRFNNLDGINTRNGAADNWWSQVATYANGGLGIDENAPSDGANLPTPPVPRITGVTNNGATATVSGIATPSSGFQTVSVEVYYLLLGAGGYEGSGYYFGAASVDFAGNWSLSFDPLGARCFIAFQTIYVPGNFTRDSSELGPSSCRTYLPLIRR